MAAAVAAFLELDLTGVALASAFLFRNELLLECSDLAARLTLAIMGSLLTTESALPECSCWAASFPGAAGLIGCASEGALPVSHDVD